jgi:hypothetical protein
MTETWHINREAAHENVRVWQQPHNHINIMKVQFVGLGINIVINQYKEMFKYNYKS